MARWKVVRFDLVIDRAFDRRIAREPDIELAVAPVPHSDEEVARSLAGAHVYHVSSVRNEMARFTFVTEKLLANAPGLLCVSTFGAGYDSVDVAACTRAGVAVVNQAGANRDSVAEHTLGLILGVAHRMIESDRKMRSQRPLTREGLMGHEVAGLVLGLVGIGEVGTAVARLAHAFRMEVIATDPFVDDAEVVRRGARRVPFDELLATADIVSLHCPRDETTLGMMGAAQYARMKRGALFITTARGGIHDEAALADALRTGHLAGAGVDVWQPEPPPLDHPLLQLDNVFATYHTAGVTHEARRNCASMGAEQIVQMLSGVKPPRFVNPEVWPQLRERLAGA